MRFDCVPGGGPTGWVGRRLGVALKTTTTGITERWHVASHASSAVLLIQSLICAMHFSHADLVYLWDCTVVQGVQVYVPLAAQGASPGAVHRFCCARLHFLHEWVSQLSSGACLRQHWIGLFGSGPDTGRQQRASSGGSGAGVGIHVAVGCCTLLLIAMHWSNRAR
jgi:hypothetical protein